MRTNKRIYLVEYAREAGEPLGRRLIEAPTNAAALRYAARTTMRVRVATQQDLVALLAKTRVEVATGEPESSDD